MSRIKQQDGRNVLEPVTIRLQPGVLTEARQKGDHVRGGTSAVLRAWIISGMRQGNIFARSMYDAPIPRNTKRKKQNANQ